MALDSGGAPGGPPIRTCVGCRTRAAKSELLRIVVVGVRALPDPKAVLPGRGAYVHPTVGCTGQAVKRRSLARALRVPQDLDAGPLLDWVAGSQRGPNAPLDDRIEGAT